MRGRPLLWAAGLAAGALVVLAAGLWRGPGPLAQGPQDIPLAAPLAGDPLRITVFGSSLSSELYDWPEALVQALTACSGRSVTLSRVTQPGASIHWAGWFADDVRATQPDLVLMEFAVNDADVTDGVWLARAPGMTADIIARLRRTDAGAGDADGVAPQIVLMTMNPARGLRALNRPRLSAHYAATRAVAAAEGTGLVDLEARWRALPRGERGLEADGLHPDADLARALIVPVLADYLSPGCTPS